LASTSPWRSAGDLDQIGLIRDAVLRRAALWLEVPHAQARYAPSGTHGTGTVRSASEEHEQADVKLANSGLLALAVGAVALVLAACESVTPAAVPRPNVAAPSSAQRPTGLITGTLGIYGGVLELNHRYSLPQAGTVRLIAVDGHIDVSVGKSGQFAVRVPTGRYDVTAGLRRPMDWPMGTCGGLFGPDAYYDRHNRLNYIVVRKNEHLRIRVGCIAG
jgi:hypothetical protein